LAAALTKDATHSLSADGGTDDRVKEVEVELGIWLASINSFVGSGPNAFFATSSADRSREARIVYAALLRSSMLAAILLDPTRQGSNSINDLAQVLRDLMLLMEPALRNKQLSAVEFKALEGAITERLGRLESANDLIAAADAAGSKNLPNVLHTLTDAVELETEHAELALVLPGFGRVLKYLDVVGGMLERDEPLKRPSSSSHG
jgi:hypothetical protein